MKWLQDEDIDLRNGSYERAVGDEVVPFGKDVSILDQSRLIGKLAHACPDIWLALIDDLQYPFHT